MSDDDEDIDIHTDIALDELFNVYFNASIMLRDRGYDTKAMNLKGDRKKDKVTFQKEYMRFISQLHLPHKARNSEVIVIFDESPNKKQKQQFIRTAIDSVDAEIDEKVKTVDAILITRMPKPLKLNLVKLKCQRLGRTEQFRFVNLCLDLPSHQLISKHTVITDGRTIEHLKEYYGSTMMKMLRSDPLAAWYGLQRGDVLIFEHKNPVSINEICYRLIV